MANKREQFLLVLFLSALLVAGGLFGGNAAMKHLRNQEKVLKLKEEQLAEGRRWLEEKQDWEAREGWLMANPLPAYAGQETEAAFAQEIQSSLARQGLEIVEQRLQESRGSGEIVEVGIDLVVQGKLEQMTRWLHETKQPKMYCAVEGIRLKSDPQTSLMRGEVSVVRLFKE